MKAIQDSKQVSDAIQRRILHGAALNSVQLSYLIRYRRFALEKVLIAREVKTRGFIEQFRSFIQEKCSPDEAADWFISIGRVLKGQRPSQVAYWRPKEMLSKRRVRRAKRRTSLRSPPIRSGVKYLTPQQKSDIAFLRSEDTRIMEIDGRSVDFDSHARKLEIVRQLLGRRATLRVTDTQVLDSKFGEREVRVIFMLSCVDGSKIEFVAMHKTPRRGHAPTWHAPTFHWRKILPGSYGSTQ